MADDALPAALEEISYLRACAPAIAATPEAFDLEELMPRFGAALAALDAVLKEHRPDDRETNWCHGCAYSWPCATVRAITRELTGEDGRHDRA